MPVLHHYRTVPERKVVRTPTLRMEVPVYLGHGVSSLSAEVIVIGLTRLARPSTARTWNVEGRRFICGTRDALFVATIDCPFREFEQRHYEHLDNPYEAAHQYALYLSANIRNLVSRTESLRHLRLQPQRA